MSPVEHEISRLRREARETIVRMIAEQAMGLEAQINKSERDLNQSKDRLTELKSLDVNNKEALLKHFDCRFGGSMYLLDDKQINVRELLDRI